MYYCDNMFCATGGHQNTYFEGWIGDESGQGVFPGFGWFYLDLYMGWT